MHNDIVNQLSAYLDGELSVEARARVDAHIATCTECRAVLDDLKAIVVTAPYYEGTSPERDLWAGIQQGISGAKEVPLAGRRAGSAARTFTLRQLIAASVVFAALAGGSVYVALRQPVSGTEQPFPLAVGPSPSESPSPSVSNVSNANARVGEVYDQAMGDLERVLAEGRDQLEPRTLKVIEENLRIIDRAIAEARSAIAADPANAYLRSQVAANMRRKLDILRQATDVIRASES